MRRIWYQVYNRIKTYKQKKITKKITFLVINILIVETISYVITNIIIYNSTDTFILTELSKYYEKYCILLGRVYQRSYPGDESYTK